ncbi:MAG TPA: type III PLP-dependent enzyme [Steroidobacteraceae bacterium]|jgi:ornithine decarboxylase|nr:type III PLP-dependent enzyme [Steroidobacteraceae bacterium]
MARASASRRRPASDVPDLDAIAQDALELAPDVDPFCESAIRHLVGRYGSPLFLIDAERVRRQYRRLAAALPGVDLHYALKPLPHPAVIETLQAEGAFFDLATTGEVELVRRLKVAPKRCIHTHPIKRESDIRSALSFGVDRFVVDNPDELRKFVKYRARCSLLIRVSFSSPDARCDLSRKFGCEPEAVAGLLRLASELRVRIQGLSFHVGSQAAGPAMFVEAIERCLALLAAARSEGHPADVLDIGGGFPVDYREPAMPIEEFAVPIRAALEALPAGTRVIAEPGRYIAAPAVAAVSSVMGRAERGGRWWYYLDDGLYGSYSGQMYDHTVYPLEVLAPAGGKTYPSVLAGPTCDSIDVINDHIELPKLDVGDLVVGHVMGAYTWASATDFNFFPRATVLALDRGRLMSER